MKIFKYFNLRLVRLIALAIPLCARCQTYQLSTPVNGAITMGATDLAGWPTVNTTNRVYFYTYCGFTLNFEDLTETIYLDPSSNTIRQVGFISVSPLASQFAIEEQQLTTITNTRPFPDPPLFTYVTNIAHITIALTLLDSGLSFDTGYRPLTYDQSSNAFTCDGSVQLDPMNITGSYYAVMGQQTNQGTFIANQTNSGTFSYTLSPVLAAFVTFNSVSTSGYPGLLTLNGLVLSGPNTLPLFAASPQQIAEFTAPNNFHSKLLAGGCDYWGYSVEVGWWTGTGNPISATLAVIDPPTITSQPHDLIVHAHTNAQFSVDVVGTPPFSYQWQLNGTNLAQARSSTLTISDVQQSDLGI